MNEQSAIALVQNFFEHWGPTKERLLGAFDQFFTAETVWENVGVALTTGPDEAKAFIENFPLAFDHIAVETLHIAAVGSVVLTERLDHFRDEHGTTLASFRVAGILEIVDDRIVRWREYFDTASLAVN